jgi:hypothetical protein
MQKHYHGIHYSDLARKIFLISVLAGFFSFKNCKEVDVTGDITVKQESYGEIVGSVLWDPDKDGVYTTVAGATVERYPPGGGMPERVTTGTGGGFSFHNVPIGTYNLRGLEIVYSPTYSVWEKWTDASVTKGNVTRVDLNLECVQGCK